MRRSNTAFIVSLIIHILGALILMNVHRSESERRGKSSIAVQFDVKAPEPRLEKKKPKFEPIDLRTDRRSNTRQQNMQVVKIDHKMDNTKVYRDVAVTEESENPFGLEASARMGSVTPSTYSQTPQTSRCTS